MTTTALQQKRAAFFAAATALLCFAALLATPQAGWAQKGAKGGPPASGGTTIPKNQAEFEKQVGITADQKNKITAIQKKYAAKAKVLQTQLQALNAQASKEVDTVLTPTQKAKIKAIQAAMMRQRQGGGAPPR